MPARAAVATSFWSWDPSRFDGHTIKCLRSFGLVLSVLVGGVMHRKIAGFLNAATQELCRYLAGALPSISDTWWPDHVVAVLTHQQQRAVEQRNITSLAGLDLSALLRVLDQNWNAVNGRESFPSDFRHYLKEMQSVRNRWAHAGTNEIPRDDVYRDLDTLQRFVSAINKEAPVLTKIQPEKNSLRSTPSPATASPDRAAESDLRTPATRPKAPTLAKRRNDPTGPGKQKVPTTRPGYENRNRQLVVQRTNLPGTDHRQRIYVLRCLDCSTEYGANGSDIFQRRCPECQGGAPGLGY